MGLLEGCVGIDQKMLQEILIPLMNVSRRCMDGTVQEDEVLNQSQIYINILNVYVIFILSFSYYNQDYRYNYQKITYEQK